MVSEPLLERAYRCVPVPVQNVFVTGAGYQKNRRRYGPAYWRERRWLRIFDRLPIEEKLNYQTEALRDFLKFSQAHSPYWSLALPDSLLNRINSPSDLAILPVMEKEDLRSNFAKISTITESEGHVGHTGGTTGTPLQVIYTTNDLMRRMAMLDHFKSRVGFEHRTMRRATFSGKHIVPDGASSKTLWRYNGACRQMLYSTFHINEHTLASYVNSLNAFRPHAIDGFPSSVKELATYVLENDITLDFTPVAVFPTSETVTPEDRAILEQAFNCKVFDQYASSEGAPFVTECREQVKHVELASGVFESLGGQDNELAVTSFTTHGTPLIRYRVGDSMDFGPVIKCDCGIASPIVNEIFGRKDDFLFRADGSRVNSGNVSNLFKNMPPTFKRAQALQASRDRVTITLEVAEEYDITSDAILVAEFRQKFGSDTQLEIVHTKHIPVESSGKFRMIKNFVDDEFRR
jgi:phenylacetate-CoA ligase